MSAPQSDHREEIKAIRQTAPRVMTTATHHVAVTQEEFSDTKKSDVPVIADDDASIKTMIRRKTMKKSDKENRCNIQQKNFDRRCHTTNCKYAVSDIAEQCTEISQRFIAEETEIRRQKIQM